MKAMKDIANAARETRECVYYVSERKRIRKRATPEEVNMALKRLGAEKVWSWTFDGGWRYVGASLDQLSELQCPRE